METTKIIEIDRKINEIYKKRKNFIETIKPLIKNKIIISCGKQNWVNYGAFFSSSFRLFLRFEEPKFFYKKENCTIIKRRFKKDKKTTEILKSKELEFLESNFDWQNCGGFEKYIFGKELIKSSKETWNMFKKVSTLSLKHMNSYILEKKMKKLQNLL